LSEELDDIEPGLVLDTVLVPCPAGVLGLEVEGVLLVEVRDEGSDEEGVSAGGVVDQAGEFPGLIEGRGESIDQEGLDILDIEGFDLEGVQGAGIVLDGPDGGVKRVEGIDFIFAVCGDDEQVAEVSMREELVEDLEGGGVGPLPVINEEDDRVFGLAECAEEISERSGEAMDGFLREDFRDWGLGAEEDAQFGGEFNQEAGEIPGGSYDIVFPGFLVFGQCIEEGDGEGTEGEPEAEHGGFTVELVEFSLEEEAVVFFDGGLE
jgi:hypothetical protein